MSKVYCAIILPVCLCTLLTSSCSNTSAGVGDFTVSGTVTGTNWYIVNPVTVTVSQGSNQYTTQVNLSNPGSSSSQTVKYSISGVPSGSYTMKLTTPTATSGVGFPSNFPTYTVNGGSKIVVPAGDIGCSWEDLAAPYIVYFSLTASISSDETIDVDMGSGTLLK